MENLFQFDKTTITVVLLIFALVTTFYFIPKQLIHKFRLYNLRKYEKAGSSSFGTSGGMVVVYNEETGKMNIEADHAPLSK